MVGIAADARQAGVDGRLERALASIDRKPFGLRRTEYREIGKGAGFTLRGIAIVRRPLQRRSDPPGIDIALRNIG